MAELEYEKHPGEHYAILRLNRPQRLNALGRGLLREFSDALDDFEEDPAMRCGIVTGTGRAFSAGADLKEMAERNTATQEIEAAFEAGEIDADERKRRLDAWRHTGSAFRMSTHPKPFIGAINGLCLAGGMELATDCDFRIASKDAYFGLFEVKRGIMAAYAVQHLTRLIPYGAVQQMLLTADRLSVEDAYRYGFVNEIHEPDDLMPRAVELAIMIASNAPLAVQGSKSMAAFWRRHGMQEAEKLNEWISRAVFGSEDAREGPLAFAEKREPEWKGR